MEKQAELVLDIGAVLGEGSLWYPPAQVLYWVDIMGRKVHIYDPGTGENRSIDVPQDVGTVVTRESGGLMLAVRDGFASLDTDTGTMTMLKEIKADGIRFNDGKCDPAGRFWAGTMAYDIIEGAGKCYCLDPDLTVRTMIENVTISNGLVWTSDRKTMYFVDSTTYEVAGFDYDLATGNISNRRVVAEVDRDLGVPDGMTIDDRDRVWVAIYGGSRVICWDPVTGKQEAVIHVPGAERVTSCSLGGPNLDELYITTAGGDLPEAERANQPHAGGLFKARLEGVRGVPPYEFKG